MKWIRTRPAATPRSSSSCSTAAWATRRSMAWCSCSSTAATTTSYAAFDLDGFVTNAQGYFTIGNPGVPGVDLIFNPGAAGLLQNGADAVALFAGNAADFPNGTAVTTTNLQDAIVYDTDDAGRCRPAGAAQRRPAAGEREWRRQRRHAVERALSERHGRPRNTSAYQPAARRVRTAPTPARLRRSRATARS